MDLCLRFFDPSDFETLYQIDQACYPRGIAYSRRTLRQFLSLPRSLCLVALTDARICAFILADVEGTVGHIITLDVQVAYRRKGFGSRLLLLVEKILRERGVREMELETACDNLAAIAFWTRHGYRTSRVLKRYYLGRTDAFLMVKTLPVGQET